MQANQALLIEGTRHPRCLSFTLEHTDNYSDHRHFGEALSRNALSVFNTKMKESLFKTSAGGNRIAAVLVDRSRIDVWSELMGAAEIVDRMERNNTAILSSAAHRKLRQLIESLSSKKETLLRPVVKTHHSNLVQELVRYSFRSSTTPISLSSVCHTVQQAAVHLGFVSRNHFASAYREMFVEAPRTTLLASH